MHVMKDFSSLIHFSLSLVLKVHANLSLVNINDGKPLGKKESQLFPSCFELLHYTVLHTSKAEIYRFLISQAAILKNFCLKMKLMQNQIYSHKSYSNSFINKWN